MKRGEVYWYRLASPDKRRPVLVLTRSDLIAHLSTVTVASISTTILGVASEVALAAESGLPRACAVNLHNVFTVPRSDVGPFVATLGGDVMARVDRALVFALGIGEASET